MDKDIPFDLQPAYESFIAELGKNKFKEVSRKSRNSNILIAFTKGKTHKILASVTKEDITVRHYNVLKNPRKLLVIYVIKPEHRKFKLVI